ncbi:hypothetical protein BDFB_004537, partial [Asbolus verrucosus]
MEEADVLGDWIAIMANGKLQCYDTPISLKNKYSKKHLLLYMDKKSLYANLFNTLDTEKCSLGIVTVGLSITTLSDVFLKARDEIDGQNVDAMGMYNE